MVASRRCGRVALRQKLADASRGHGLTHPKNPQNTWNNGRPHAALLKVCPLRRGSKAKKDRLPGLMPSLNRRRVFKIGFAERAGISCRFLRSSPPPDGSNLSKDEILDHRGRAQGRSTTTTRRKKSKEAPAPGHGKYASELFAVGHRLILGLKEHDRRSGERHQLLGAPIRRNRVPPNFVTLPRESGEEIDGSGDEKSRATATGEVNSLRVGGCTAAGEHDIRPGL